VLLDEQCNEMVQWNNQYFVNNIKNPASLSFELDVPPVVTQTILEIPFENLKMLSWQHCNM
jgi:hypothetical protein